MSHKTAAEYMRLSANVTRAGHLPSIREAVALLAGWWGDSPPATGQIAQSERTVGEALALLTALPISDKGNITMTTHDE